MCPTISLVNFVKHSRRTEIQRGVLREKPILTKVRYIIIPVRIASVKRIEHATEVTDTNEYSQTFGGNINWYSLYENSMETSQKI
jgi:hypothetical protein